MDKASIVAMAHNGNGWRVIVVLLLLLMASHARAEPMRFIHNAPESANDNRYNYHWQVLQAALEITRPTWGDYQLTAAVPMSESRQVNEMIHRSVHINTLVLDATKTLEQHLLAVRVPIDRGLLGYRVFLIRGQDQPRFSAVFDLDQLRRLTIGQGAHWSDVDIFRHARFDVVTGANYEGLFAMLDSGRFDAFGRGVTEISGEFAAHHGRYPRLAIEQELLLYYPMPVYFWFQQTDDGQRMQARVQEGMEQLVANGTLEAMFETEFAPIISQLNLSNRRLFRLDNPLISDNHPFADQRLWFNPKP